MEKPPETIDKKSINVMNSVLIEDYVNVEMERSPNGRFCRRFQIDFRQSVQRVLAFLYSHEDFPSERVPDYEDTKRWYETDLTTTKVESWGNPDKIKNYYNCVGVKTATVSTWNTKFELEQITICKVVRIHFRSLLVPYNSEFHLMIENN